MSVSLIDGHIDRNEQTMSDNEIIKAYEDKVNLIGSMTSVYLDGEDGFDLYEVMLNSLDLVNRQKEEITKNENIIEAAENLIDSLKKEIESLIAGQKTLQKALNEKIEEVKRLQTYITNHPYRVVMGTADIYTETHEEYEKLLEKISTEAVKECLDKIEQMDVSESDNYIMVKKIEFDNLVKETVGEG